jgi:membrane protein involved in colicin uptake
LVSSGRRWEGPFSGGDTDREKKKKEAGETHEAGDERAHQQVRCETEAEAKAEKDGKIRAHQRVRRETKAEAKKKKKSCMQAHGKIRAHQRVRRETEAEAKKKKKSCVQAHGKIRAHQRVRRDTKAEAEATPDLEPDGSVRRVASARVCDCQGRGGGFLQISDSTEASGSMRKGLRLPEKRRRRWLQAKAKKVARAGARQRPTLTGGRA